MNRVHNAQQSLESIKLAKEKEFTNISIDLIYGLPSQTNDEWRDNINIALQLNIPHLSCYALTVEEGTALAKHITQKKR